MMYKTDIVFILKERIANYGVHLSSGLANSIEMLVKMLRSNSIDAIAHEVFDGNGIDRLVTLCRPRAAVLEALWVTPAKLAQLAALHPKITWVVRIHSNLPFLANEGMAMEWLGKISQIGNPKVIIAANSRVMQRDLQSLLGSDVIYLPNHYDVEVRHSRKKVGSVLDVSCFGAIRPLKNQLIQAAAAIMYADAAHKKLRFHINSSRVEGQALPILKNIRALFDFSPHKLVEHDWLTHREFKRLIRAEIDLGLQVSYSETYNIVAADHIDCGVPVVTSDEVAFVHYQFQATPNSTSDIVEKMHLALHSESGARSNTRRLQKVNEVAETVWTRSLGLDYEI